MSSTIIGYDVNDVAISSLSQTKNETYLIPIRRNGSILRYLYASDSKLDLSYEFTDEVRITSMYGNLLLQSLSNDNTQYIMFPTEFAEFIGSVTIQNGVFSGRFKFRKRGPKIGVQYLGAI